jgi:DNA repair protein RadA/Sms
VVLRPRATPLSRVEEEAVPRRTTGLTDLDRVLGGGLVPGSVVLLGGEPGIGKSTLWLQAARSMTGRGGQVLYVSAEESARQVRLRGARLGAVVDEVFLLAETDADRACAEAAALEPAALIVDSIQAVCSEALSAAPGSVAQVRACALAFQRLARQTSVPVVLIGHVTKDGSLAGPKSLEHLVDTVLSFEGDRSGGRRVLRAMKNRFGPVEEVALFEMTREGLREIADPSGALLLERRAGAPGSAVSASIEGTRPLLVEIQALAGPVCSGSPRRSAVGLDPGRLSMILAVLESRAGLALANRDVFVSCTGGIEVREPAVDLAIAAALASSRQGVALPADALYVGEIGLLGEVRSVPDAAARLREGVAHGFRRAFVPRSDAAAGDGLPELAVCPVSEIGDLLSSSAGSPPARRP